jgi:hypothetical protein
VHRVGCYSYVYITCYSNSIKYRVRINYRSTLQNHIFTNTEQKYMMLLPFQRGMFAVSLVTTTSKLPPERALNRHKTVTSRKFQDTPTTLGRRGSNSRQHWFTLFQRNGSSDYRTIPNFTFTVCNRHEFHDLATLPTPVMA